MSRVDIRVGDSRELLKAMPDKSVHMCVTSPPYFNLRDYEMEDQLGMEATPDEYVANLVALFQEVRRVLRDDGTLWIVIGDSYWSRPNGSLGKTSIDGSKKHAAEYRRTNALRKNRKAPGGIKHKDLIGIPWMLAFALRADGWYLRQDLIWSKPNPMPESMKDRCTKAHEYIFMFSKRSRYHYDQDAIAEGFQTDPSERYEERARITGRGTQASAAARGNDRAKSGGFPPRQRGHAQYTESSDQSGLDTVPRGAGRIKRSVWTVATQPYPEAHFATYPPALIEPCILAGCPAGGTVLDVFAGAGTTGLVADRLQRKAILLELNPEYVAMARRRIDAPRGPLLDSMEAA